MLLEISKYLENLNTEEYEQVKKKHVLLYFFEIKMF